MTNLFEEPAFVIDLQRVSTNIANMVTKTDSKGIDFTPHFKTHQSRRIGQIFREKGITGIKVSSLKMGKYFAGDGWQDITIAFPFHPGMMERAEKLAKKCSLGLFVNSIRMAEFLKKNFAGKSSVYIEIDTGLGRSGVNPDDLETIADMIDIFNTSSDITFKGFYTHTGNSYQGRGRQEIQAYHTETERAFARLRTNFIDAFPSLVFCSGDTPTASVVEDFGVINQISAGNFVYYDLMQVEIGACTLDDIAVVLTAPIAEIDKERGQMVVHGGAVHLSKESIIHHKYEEIYGLPVPLYFDGQGNITGWGQPMSGCYVTSLSQEHGVIKVTEEFTDTLQEGKVLGILPVHSCLSANLMRNNELFI